MVGWFRQLSLSNTLLKIMNGIPVKIIYKKELKQRCHCNEIGYGVLGSKKTGKPIQVTRFNHKTGEKKIMFEDKKEMKIMKELLKKT